MVKLTPRLMAVANLVRKNSVLVDIGCDHGYLPVYLLQNKIIVSAVASDINSGPLKSCISLVESTGLGDKVKCVISNGLENVNKDEYTDVSFCGMGGELIAALLENVKCDFAKDKHYIFNPMTHPEILRKYLCENGFKIGADIIVKEGKRYYNVFDAYYTGEKQAYDDVYYFLGNINDFTYKEYFTHILNYLENKEKGGSNYSAVIAAVKEKL